MGFSSCTPEIPHLPSPYSKTLFLLLPLPHLLRHHLLSLTLLPKTQSFSSTSFFSAALSSGSPASTVEHLLQAIRQLDFELRSHVLSNHPLLLTQLSSLNNAELSLSTLRSSISSLQSSLRRVRSELSEPHNSVLSKTIQPSNLHRTSELLSHSIRAVRLSKKLRDPMASAEAEPDKLDLAKAA